MCRNPDLLQQQPPPSKAGSSTTTTHYFSLKEVAQHNVPEDAWCSVHGSVLNITEFAKRHPGGDLILLAAGKDATTLVETYHPAGYPAAAISKLEIGRLNNESNSFYSWNESEFYSVLKQRVVQRLKDRKLTRRGSTEIQIKALLILFGFWYSLYKMYTTSFGVGACWWTMVMGVFAHFVGTCIQHDGNHGAFSQQKWLNKVAGWTLDMIGASGFTWEIQHMLGHHPYTNLLDVKEANEKLKGTMSSSSSSDPATSLKDQESDPDVFSSFPLMRMHPHQSPAWYHAYQHFYAPFLFAFMTIAKVLQQDFEIVFSGKLYHIDAMCRYGSKLNVARFWIMKVITTLYMVGIPCYCHGIGRGLFLFVLGHFTCGEVLATMFIVNHVIEGVSYLKKNDDDKDDDKASTSTQQRQEKVPQTFQGVTPMKSLSSEKGVPLNDWAAVQCQTSVNWSPGSWFWNHVSGGLSHQIEHHLFPSLCHTHYVYIQDVVESTCHEYGVPYQSEPSLYVAYGKMMSHLRDMGQPQPAETDAAALPSAVKAKSE